MRCLGPGRVAFFALQVAFSSLGAVAADYIVADPVAEVIDNNQVLARIGMGRVVKLQQVSSDGAWGRTTVDGVTGWINSKNLVEARPLSIAYFQGTALFNAAQQSRQAGNAGAAQTGFTEAVPLLRRAADLARREGNQRYLSSASTNLAICHDGLGQYDKAEPNYLEALRINEALLGQGNVRIGDDSRNLANFYTRWKKPAEALTWFEKAMRVYEAAHGPDHPETARLRLEVGMLLLTQRGDYEAAESMLTRARAVLTASLGANDPQTLKATQFLADIASNRGNWVQAETLYREVLAAREQTQGADHIALAGTCQQFATVCLNLGKLDEVEALQLRSLRLREINLGPDHPNVILNLRDLADLASTTGNYEKSRTHLERALAIARNQGAGDPRSLANVQEGFGNLHKMQGRYEQAEQSYRESLATLEKAGAAPFELAHTLNALAKLLMLAEKPGEAKPVVERRLGLLEAQHGRDSLSLVEAIEGLATIERLGNRPDEAERLQKRALGIVQLHPDAGLHEAAVWNNLGAVYAVQNRTREAEEAYRRSLEQFERLLDPDNHRTAYTRINLALAEQRLGRFAEARKRAGEARWSLDRNPGDFDLAKSVALSLEADCALSEGRLDLALELADRFRRLTRKRVDKLLLARSERERLEFLRGAYHVDFHRHLAWVLDHPSNPETARATAEWAVNGKGLANELEAELVVFARKAGDGAGAILERLAAIRSQIATHLGDSGGEVTAEAEAKRKRLIAEEADLTRELRSLGAPEAVGGTWVELDDLRKAIPREARLVECVRVQPSSREARYLAWVIPPEGMGEPVFVDLGPAEAIEKALAEVHREIGESFTRIAESGEAAAEARLRDTLSPLARLLWTPLEPALGDAGQCLIAPDGALWLVPWAALPTGEDGYLVDRVEFRFLATGRDCLASSSTPTPNAPLILADPDYDLGPEAVRKAASSLGLVDSKGLRGASPSISRATLPEFPRLPGTAEEARAIAPALATFSGTEPEVLLGEKALESVFLARPRPRVLVMSTHGFFLEDQALGGPDNSTAIPLIDRSSKGTSVGFENPLLRCGLLFAGCNQRGTPGTDRPDDGILSGLEILAADLEGCELVVLSACETGLGDLNSGEGVAGLRQAFHLAGAEAVIASLWEIPDAETALLMGDLFRRMAGGDPAPVALREAQQNLLKTRRETHGAAHPLFWAAFGITMGGG